MSDKIKTLSQAMRLGATFRPQCRGSYFRDGESCAFGAVLEVLGFDPTKPVTTDAELRAAEAAIKQRGWHEALRKSAPCPECGSLHQEYYPHSQTSSMFVIGVVLNNEHGWSRERIADWLESQGL